MNVHKLTRLDANSELKEISLEKPEPSYMVKPPPQQQMATAQLVYGLLSVVFLRSVWCTSAMEVCVPASSVFSVYLLSASVCNADAGMWLHRVGV